VAYPSTTFSATGGSGSYTWSVGTGSASLPNGLSFSGGVFSGTPSGDTGMYDFSIQVTDSQGRTVTMNYTITIN
jgi:predicted ATP-dependent Lon-type protease